MLALEITDRSESLFDFVPRSPGFGDSAAGSAGYDLLLIPGTERTGVRAPLLARCDAAVHLPMYGENTSMNVAVALGAAVYLLLARLGGV